MSRIVKQRHADEVKYCVHCANLMSRKRQRNGVLESNLHFSRRKYCDRDCMKRDFTLRASVNSTESNSRSNARLRMEYFIGYDSCQSCESESNLDVHHVDEDPFNNDINNLTLLCRSCHIKAHRGGR